MEYPDGFVSGLPNCGVTAIAIATKTPYPYVWEWFASFQKRPASWKGMTCHSKYLRALYKFGKTRSYECPKSINYGKTLKHWANNIAEKDKTYLVRVTGHALVYRNGMCIDNIKRAIISCHWTKGKKVKNAWVVM